MKTKKPKNKTADGFNCMTCGRYEFFGVWVAAHANEVLTHTCRDCGTQHSIYEYVVTLKKKGKVRRIAK